MSLKGNLSSVNLTEIFQMLSLSGREGTLFIYEGSRKRAICFTKEGVSIRSRERNENLLIGKILVRLGCLDEQQLQQAVETRRSGDKLIGDVLVDSGLCGREDVEEAFRVQSAEEIQDLFLYRSDAQFEYVDEFFPETEVPYVNLNVNALLIEIARRTDEWEYIRRRIRGPREIYHFTGVEAQIDGDTLQECFADRIDPLIDGASSVRDIIERSYVGKFEVCKLLANYLDAGIVELVPHETIRQNAALALRMGDAGSAIRHYEYLMSSGDFPLEVMSEAAAAHEANRDYGEAATLRRRLAEEVVRSGEVANAIVALHGVANYPRPEPDALRYLLELALDHPKAVGEFGPSIVEAGKTLVAHHLGQEQYHEALALLERLVAAFPDELAFADSLVNTYYDDGLAERAISECERLAAGYLKRRRTTQAVSLYKKLLVLDPERSDIRDKIRKITNPGRRSTRSPGALPRVAVTLAVMLLLGGVALVMLRQEPGNTADASAVDHGTRQKLHARATEELGSAEEHAARATERYRNLVELLRDNPVDRRDELMKAAGEAGDSEGHFTKHHENVLSIARALRLQAGLQEDAARSRQMLATARELEERVQVSRATWLTKAQEAAERLFKDSQEDYRSGEHRRALAALELASNIATDEEWMRLAAVDQKLRTIRGEIRGVEVNLAQAKSREEEGDYIGARGLYMDLLREFRGSDLVRELRLPVEVRTVPPGAAIRIAGEDHPHKTPAILRVSPFGQTEVEFSKPGFTTRAVKLGPYGDETDPGAFQFGWQILKAPTWSAATNEVLESAPARWKGRLAVAGRNGRWLVFDAKSGKQLGAGRLDADAAVAADLVASGSTVFLPSLNGTLYALDAENVKLTYRVPGRDQPIDAPPASADGVLYYVDHEGMATAFDPETRKSRWTKPSLPAVYAAPLVLGDRVVIVSTGGEVVLLSCKDGETVKRFTLPGGTYRCAPAVIGEDLLFASEGGKLTRYDLRNDQIVWTGEWPVRIRRTPPVSGGAVYLSPLPGELIVIDATAGKESYRFSNTLTLAGAAVSPNHRVFFAHDRTLSAFAPGKDGYGLAWSFEARAQILAGPVVHGEAVYVGDADGNIYRLEAVDE
jgi:outer membrane protein assembly factor BamB/tetratricopeptide (TPR) repeat protein